MRVVRNSQYCFCIFSVNLKYFKIHFVVKTFKHTEKGVRI